MVVSRAVLVTGCASGIGATLARRLHEAGFPVFATARRHVDLEPMVDAGLGTMVLDVCDEASARSAVTRVVDEYGAVGALVNNAGYACSGRWKRSRSTRCEDSSRPTCRVRSPSWCFPVCGGRIGGAP